MTGIRKTRNISDETAMNAVNEIHRLIQSELMGGKVFRSYTNIMLFKKIEEILLKAQKSNLP